MDLKFLDDEDPVVPVKVVTTPKILIHDPAKTNFVEESKVFGTFTELPFVQEAVRIARDEGIIVVKNLQEAFQRRSLTMPVTDQNATIEMFGENKNKEVEVQRALTIRESVTVFRSAQSEDKMRATLRSNFFWVSLMKMVGTVTEEDEENSSLVFYLRFRLNRAIDFIARNPNDTTSCQRAKNSINEISESLAACGYPLFPLETNGVHEEFLKPEGFTFLQFANHLRNRPVNRAVSDDKIQSEFIRRLTLIHNS